MNDQMQNSSSLWYWALSHKEHDVFNYQIPLDIVEDLFLESFDLRISGLA